MNHYPHHIGDFNNATRHLTRVERSLYRDLLDLYYDTETPLPAGDIHRLARRVCCEQADIPALETVLNEFFALDGDVYRHERCDKEIARYHSQISTARKAGQASAQRRSNARSTAVEVPLHQPEPEPEPIKESRQRTPRGVRLPAAFEPDKQFAVDMGLNFALEFAKFCDYWQAQPGQKGVKLDWPATWRNWCRNAKPANVTKFGRPDISPEDADQRARLAHEQSQELLRKQAEHAAEVERQRLERIARKAA